MQKPFRCEQVDVPPHCTHTSAILDAALVSHGTLHAYLIMASRSHNHSNFELAKPGTLPVRPWHTLGVKPMPALATGLPTTVWFKQLS